MAQLLTHLKEQKSIQIVESCPTWRDAVRLCFKPLKEQGCLTDNYIEAAIRSAEELNFYYLIAEGLAMPHARPEEGALKMGFSLLAVRQGVSFGSHPNSPVYCLIGLSATDSNSHIDAMMDISEIFSEENIIQQVIAQKDEAALEALLAR